MAGKFEIRKSSAGYRFVLKASNGEIIATSETYTTTSGSRTSAGQNREAGKVSGEA